MKAHAIFKLKSTRSIARGTSNPGKFIAANLSKVGWRCGCISSTDDEGRQFWVVAAEREDSGRFIVRADEKLTAFLELEAAGCA
jgi:hypothetical protein